MHSGDIIIKESHKHVVRDMIAAVRHIIIKDGDVHQYLTDFIDQYAKVTSKDHFTHTIYMRKTIDGVP